MGWIKKEQKKFREQARESERLMINRESHYLFGERYLLDVQAGKRNTVRLNGKKMVLTVTDTTDKDLKQRVLYRYYRQELRKRLEISEPLMRRRWA